MPFFEESDFFFGADLADLLRSFLSDEEAGNSYRAIIEWLLLGAFAYALLRGFLWRFRSRFKRNTKFSFDEREQLDPETGAGWMGLLSSMLPAWLRGTSPVSRSRQFPRGLAGISEVFDLYYDLLDAAARRGFTFDRTATPLERVDTLRSALKSAPVEEITDCFNRACYAGRPSATAITEQLSERLNKSG